MKKILSLLVIPFILLAQENNDKNPSVELPEFVITGKELMELQRTKKPESDLLPVVSESFMKPVQNPDELELGEIQGPREFNVSLRDSVLYNTGIIKALFGIYSLPKIGLRVSAPYRSGLFEGHLNGQNIRPYVDNAERYSLNAGAGILLFPGFETSFLPGTEYGINTDFNSRSVKFFAGSEPALKRNLYQGIANVSAANVFSDKFQFGIKSGYQYTLLKDESFEEGLFSVNSFSKLKFSNFIAGIVIDYSNQMIKDSNTTGSYFNYVYIRPYAGFEFTKLIKAAFGLSYSHARNSNYTTLFANVGIKISDQLTLLGEFSPGGDFVTASELLDRNIYFNPQHSSSFFVKRTLDLKGMLKYEYGRYFEISGGFKYRKYDNLVYYMEMSPEGKFNAASIDADLYGIFVNFLFHKGPFGYFYGSAEAQEVREDKNNLVPYFPSVISSVTYGYDFPVGINTEVNLTYNSETYADIINSVKINSYINLNFNLSYKLSDKLKLIAGLNNLLNHKNYIWNNYREAPLDISAGISYIW